jgi:hypothetical protein
MIMRRIQPNKIRIKHSLGNGMFHDSREDINSLAKAINHIVEKQNEIIVAVNELIDSRGDKHD